MTPDVQVQERESLKKTMSFGNYISIGLGSMVGIAWVMYTGQWLTSGGPIGAILAFVICGLLLLPVGACYAEMTTSIPVAGGALAFVYRAFGTLPAFLTAWGLALLYVSVPPFETIAIGALIESAFPLYISEPLYWVGEHRVSWSSIVPGLIAGGFLFWLNYSGAKGSARFQLWSMYLMFACVLVFGTTALIKGDASNLIPMFASEGSFWAVGPTSIVAVLVTTPFFMAGWDAIPQAAEEAGMKMKPKQLGFAILFSISMGALFYVVIILAAGLSVPSEQMSEIMQRKDVLPTAEVFRIAFGYEWAAKLVLFAALLGLLTTLNAILLGASRLLFSLARGGMLPHSLAKVHPTHGTPSNAIILVGTIGLVGPFIGMAAFVPVVNSGSFAVTFTLFMTTIAALRLRRSAPELKRPYRSHLTTLVMASVIALGLLSLMVLPQSPGQLSTNEFLFVGTWLVIGVIGYGFRRMRGDMSDEERSYMILGDYRPTPTSTRLEPTGSEQ